MEKRLANNKEIDETANQTRYNNELYQYLKQLWQSHPPVSSREILPVLLNFVAADGSSPYQSTMSHTPAFAHVMSRMVEEQQGDSPIYIMLQDSLNEAMFSDGIFNRFRVAMMTPPKEPEPW